MQLEKYSIGIGDRFAHQGNAQLLALLKAKQAGVDIVPIWNKSYREHTIIGTSPIDVRKEADWAVEKMNWQDSYYVDADHINMNNVDNFVDHSDFFTIDVADYIGQQPNENDFKQFVTAAKKYSGVLSIPGIDRHLEIAEMDILRIGNQFLFAVKEAGRIYRHIEKAKGKNTFVTEVSMDEVNASQSPLDMFFILLMIAQENIPIQTIAPKFAGRFNKGVDYVGDIAKFEEEFDTNIAIIQFAVKEYELPENLKLSIHSGSDKFAIYAPIHKGMKKWDVGLHLKTAGTTWLEELIGLAEAGGDGLEIAKEIYTKSLNKSDELCAPYATVVDIDPNGLPTPEEVAGWDGRKYAETLRHDPTCKDYNPNFRQLLHVGYRVAAQMSTRFLDALVRHEDVIAEHVTENIFNRHIKRIFMDE